MCTPDRVLGTVCAVDLNELTIPSGQSISSRGVPLIDTPATLIAILPFLARFDLLMLREERPI